jgi:hypothetical protein
MVLRILLWVIAKGMQSNSPDGVNADRAALHICAVAFIRRFGLIVHVHFHVCVVDGVFEAVAGSAIFDQPPVSARPPSCGAVRTRHYASG